LIEIKDSFALWLDSPYSFRVYIFAKVNYNEFFTERVYLPLHEWINIQMTVDATKGVTVMTFN